MPFRIATTANGDKSQIGLAGKQVYPSVRGRERCAASTLNDLLFRTVRGRSSRHRGTVAITCARALHADAVRNRLAKGHRHGGGLRN